MRNEMSGTTPAKLRSGLDRPGRRALLLGALAFAVAGRAGAQQAASPAAQQGTQEVTIPIEVWKSPDCGCCQEWVKHMEENGFRVTVNDSGNEVARAGLGIPPQLGSCHTALVAGYAIEGHVPASEVRRLLEEKPDAVGLAVPGMPVGSPGMDGPEYEGRKEPYDVLLVKADGSTSVYRQYR